MPAFYRRSLAEFLADDDTLIVGRLTSESSLAGFFQQVHAQTEAWKDAIVVLKRCARSLCADHGAGEWAILLEYPIPRRGKRIDALFVAASVLVVMEFKCGARVFGREAILQVEDYCLDLADFHGESR